MTKPGGGGPGGVWEKPTLFHVFFFEPSPKRRPGMICICRSPLYPVTIYTYVCIEISPSIKQHQISIKLNLNKNTSAGAGGQSGGVFCLGPAHKKQADCDILLLILLSAEE